MNILRLRVSVILPVFCLCLMSLSPAAAAAGQEAGLKEQMQRKLDNMGELLTGLALEDWSKIGQGTQGLLNTCEALSWTGAAKEEFEMRDKAFHTAVKRLSRFVNAKNGDGARLQFVEMVVLCMDCHDLGKE